MPRFVVQEHHARNLHWDFRLEMDGVLKSWAVPKGPSMNPADKRLALAVPDHGMDHADYEGIIPEDTYGSGPVLIWDAGSYSPIEPADPVDGIKKGNLSFQLDGKLLKGAFALVRMKGPGKEKAWLLIKKKDASAEAGWKTPVLLTPERKTKLDVKMPSCSVED